MELNSEHTITLSDLQELPPLLERHADFTVWVLNKVRKFPRDIRFGFGNHISSTSLNVMDRLLDALYSIKGSNDRLQPLQDVSSGIEKLRLQLRMAWKLKLINAKALHYASGCLMEEGRMLGGWIKSESKAASKNTHKSEFSNT